MAKHKEINVPFIEARNVGSKQKPTAIVLRISSTTSEKGAALAIATYHHSLNAPAESYHYIVDEAKTYRCVSDFIASSRNPYRTVSVLLCVEPNEYNPYVTKINSIRVMNRAASLIAELMVLHKIPVRYLDGDLEKKWIRHKWRRRGGLIVRAVGTWPYDSFLSNVKERIVEKTTDTEQIAQ